MKHHRKAPLTRQQVIDCLRGMRTRLDVGESMTSHHFREHTGVTMREVRWRFGSWSGVRRELRLYHRARPRQRWTVDDLCREFHACVEKLGRLALARALARQCSGGRCVTAGTGNPPGVTGGRMGAPPSPTANPAAIAPGESPRNHRAFW